MNSYYDIKGKIVLITGASSGIGESTALLFAEYGSHLILTARRIEKLKILKEKILSKFQDSKIFIHELDVRNFDSIKKLEEDIPKELKNIDILINNAGLALGLKYIHENDLNHINQMIDTNIKGIFYMVKVFLPNMVERKSGHIINISSIAGQEGYAGGSVYCATKFAVQGLTMSMRKELVNTPIRVSSICPGLVGNTEFSLVRYDGNEEMAKKVYEGIKALVPIDVADTIIYVASRPSHIQIIDLTIVPTNQASVCSIYKESSK
jgi:3-hydroxy acid dehydrogenase/malonic semialdehyde reductase